MESLLQATLTQATAALHQQDFTRAGQLFETVLVQAPTTLPALLGQAHVEWAYGNLLPALDYTNRAHRADPANLTVYELYSALLAQLNYPAQAKTWAEQGLALHPGSPTLLGNLALLHYLAEDYPAALTLYQQLRQHKPTDATVSHMVASLSGSNPPAASPDFIREHFNGYTHFDTKLTSHLGYRVPEALITLLQPHLTTPAPHIADLGCGTGLCGQALLNQRLTPASLTGVDLAGQLLAQARTHPHQRGYTQLIAADLTDWLAAAPGHSQDVLLAADVLIYLGDLTTVFHHAARVLRQPHAAGRGLFAFSIETLEGTGQDYFLQTTSRYAHSPGYIQRLATTHGLHMLAQQDTTLRHDRNQPVPGCLYLLQV